MNNMGTKNNNIVETLERDTEMAFILNNLYLEMVRYYGTGFLVKSNKTFYTEKRQLFMLIAREQCVPHKYIQEFLGMKSHASVVLGVKHIKGLLDYDIQLQKQYLDLTNR